MIRHQTFLFGENGNEPFSEIVVFDFETTGFSPTQHEIIQIAATKLSDGKLKRGERFATYVKPSRAIPPEITQLTGIQRSHVKDAPRLKVALKMFSEFCGNSTLVGHNIHCFDVPFLRNACSGIRCQTREVTYFDSMHLSKLVWVRDLTFGTGLMT